MNLDRYIKRNRTNLKEFCLRRDINSFEELCLYCKKVGIKIPNKEELNYEFKKDVEKRPAIKSSSKKKRVSGQKSKQSKTNDSTSAGRSGSSQRIRKSPAKRQRKSDSDKVESVQPASGSEDTK